jgi:hypothetical protein
MGGNTGLVCIVRVEPPYEDGNDGNFYEEYDRV